MSKIDIWRKHNVRDFEFDTKELTCIEIGAYVQLLDRIWAKGSLPDDDGYLSRVTKTYRKWHKIRVSLERLFTIADGKWSCAKLETLRETAQEISDVRKKAIQRRWENRKKINDGSDTNVSRLKYEPEPELEIDIGLAPRKRSARRSRLSEDWMPTEEGLALATDAGLDAQRELDRFRNYHQSKGSVMADWNAAWRTWIGKAVEFAKPSFAKPTAAQPISTVVKLTPRQAIEHWIRMPGSWPKAAPVSDISQLDHALLAQYGLHPDGRPMR